jgi:hypothetical protein
MHAASVTPLMAAFQMRRITRLRHEQRVGQQGRSSKTHLAGGEIFQQLRSCA